jgi:hypothetical protein
VPAEHAITTDGLSKSYGDAVAVKTSLEDVFLSLTGTSIVIDSNHAKAGAN